MSEFDSLNSTDYVYEIKAQGKHLFLRFMTVTLYVLFIIAFSHWLFKNYPPFSRHFY